MKCTVNIDRERCKGCGLCVEVCTRQILKLGTCLNKKGYRFPIVDRPGSCVGCRQCTEICPDVAIELEGEEVT